MYLSKSLNFIRNGYTYKFCHPETFYPQTQMCHNRIRRELWF